jgi:hypothetical protein
MYFKNFLLLGIAFLLIGLFFIFQREKAQKSNIAESYSVIDYLVEQKLSLRKRSGNDEVHYLVNELQSENKNIRKRAKKRLTALSKISQKSRKQVVEELIKMIGRPDIRSNIFSTSRYDGWEFAVKLLGSLKATEAMDALISCIDCNNGIIGGSLHWFPAAEAIVMMGEDAVPKITDRLNNAPLLVRRYLVWILGEIGGEKAIKSLEDQESKETDQEIKTSIKAILRSLK